MNDDRRDGAVDTIRSFAELEQLVARWPDDVLFVRYSKGPDHDREEASIDYESGLPLPGLSVNPLSPQWWWSRPIGDWLARQLCMYAHLAGRDPERFAWVLTGTVVGRGPDNEPLVADHTPVAFVDDAVVEEAQRRYHERFAVGRDSTNTPRAQERGGVDVSTPTN